MSVSALSRRSTVFTRLIAFLCALLLATLALALLPQQGYAAEGDTFTEKIPIGDEQVDCTFMIKADGTVAIGEGGFVASAADYYYSVDDAKPALPMVSIASTPDDSLITSYVADARGELIIPSFITHEGTTYQITEISSGAFLRATGITSVTIPNTVQTIGAGAFCRCNGLTYVIPSSITEIPDYCFANCSGLREITGAANVTSIGNGAYWGCTAFHNIVIPSRVQTIGDHAFYRCSGACFISMSNSVTSVGNWAFADNPALERITLSSNLTALSEYMFFQDYHLTTVANASGLTSLGKSCFSRCFGLKSFTIPEGVAVIPEDAFSATALTSITIPNSVVKIQSGAFGSCSNLTEVNFPTTGYCMLEDYAFQNCTALESLDLGHVSELEESYDYGSQFSGCSALRSVTIGNQIEMIPGGCFQNCSSLVEISIPNSVTSIGRGAFSGCSAVNSLTIPASVESIGYEAFYGCNGLVTLVFEGDSVKSLTSIWYTDYSYGFTEGISHIYVPDNLVDAYKADEKWAQMADYILPMSSKPSNTRVYALLKADGTLVECNASCQAVSGGRTYATDSNASNDYAKQAITDIKFESGVTEVPQYAFAYCYSLRSVELPSSVTNLDQYSFYNCSSLESVTGGSGVTDVQYQAFANCKALKSVPFMRNVEAMGNYAFMGCILLQSVDLSGIIRSVDFDPWDMSSFYPCVSTGAFRGCSNLSQVSFPTNGSNFKIGDEAFRYCDSLASIDLPRNVHIGENAFDDSGLTSIDIPSSTTYIDANAFSNCEQLTEVEVSGIEYSGGEVAVQQGMFSNCTALREVNLDSSIDSIYGNAFNGCGALAEIDLPNGITQIESFAFGNCTGLLSIDLPDGLIELGAGFSGCTALAEVAIQGSIDALYGTSSSSASGGAFSSCTALSSVEFGTGFSVTELGGLMFNGCSALGSITIPDAVLGIGAMTFSNCAVLKDVNLPSSLSSLSYRCFAGCPCIRTIDIPDNGVLYIGEDFNSGGGQFAQCYNLEEIELPAGTDIISKGMFYYCVSLKKITIPASVENVNGMAFRLCSNLETVIFENDCSTTEFAPEYETNPYWDETYPLDPSIFIFGECNNLSTVVFRDKKPLPDAITFSSNPTFYYTLHYFPTQELAESKTSELGFLTIKAGTNGLDSSAPAAENIYDGEWMEASVAEEGIGAEAIADSGWALPATWKGVMFTTYPESGECLDGNFTFTSEAGIKQVRGGVVTDITGPITYAWYECDASGALVSFDPVGTDAALELSGLSAGRHYYYCTASAPNDVAISLGLNRSFDTTPIVCVNVKSAQIASDPASIRYRWPVSRSDSGYGPSFSISNPSSITVTDLKWESKNGYFSLSPNSWNTTTIYDMDPGQTYNYTVYPRVPDAEVGEYEDTLIITSENAATLEIPITLIFFDDSVPYANFSYKSASGNTMYDTTVDFGTLDSDYANPRDSYYKMCTVYAEGGSVTFTGRSEPAHFDVYWESMDSFPTTLQANTGVGLRIAPKAGLAPGIYEDTLTYHYTADGVANGRMDVTLRVKVGSPGGIGVSPASCDFGSEREGYGEQDPMTITVTNYEESEITLPSNTGSSLQAFTVSGAASLTIPAGESRTFTVAPKTDLEPGTYSETLSIAPTGLSAKSVALSFEVEAIEPVTATVDFTAQMDSGFFFAPQLEVDVSSDLAESYGFADGVFYGDDVSALDVLVAAHVLTFGSDFTPETAADYLAMNNGFMTTFFGWDSDDYSGGFFLNHAMANDGTESQWGGYNGTTMDTQPVSDGDLLEFFFYEDEDYLDTYNWFVDKSGNPSREFSTISGGTLELALMGCPAMSGYLFKDADEMMASSSAEAVSDAQVAIVDLENGTLYELDDTITDENGLVSLSFDEPGNYMIAAYGTESCECKQIMSLTTVKVTAPKPGWNKIDGYWYYFDEDGDMVTSTWKKDSKGWCYLGEDGRMVTNGWAKDSNGWCWIGDSGYMVVATKWIKVDGVWYHITNGYRDANKWMKDGTRWCYLGADGTMVKSTWKKDSKGWCYLDASGYMVTNAFVPDSKGQCWLGSDGYMVVATKWIKYDGDWYHITSGYMDKSKWMKDSKGWCWLQADGKMLTNGFAKDSKGMCYIASDGYMPVTTKWVKVDGVWYHITSGYMDTSKWFKDSKGWCYVGADGKMVTEGWAKDSKGWCWLDAVGYMPVETKWIGEPGAEGSSYIINGYRVDNQTIDIGGTEYTFDSDGKLVL
ncbi:MAG: leucine-rich repeat protein [Coriobacteriales bacterium]|nr:leucine-rich repeat protein [Coriobacteriales bacterium]